MKKDRSSVLTGKMFLISWAILCISLFVISPGKVSYVQWSDLANWQQLPEKIERLRPARDLMSLLGSFADVILFSIASISLGLLIIRKSKIGVTSNPETILSRLAIVSTGFLTGTGVFSLIFLTLASAYQLTPISVVVILILGFSLG